jgi:hypothetical protein
VQKEIKMMKMKRILIFPLLLTKQINKALEGKWEVSRKDLIWVNNSNGAPQYEYHPDYATIEFNKNGKGQMILPAGAISNEVEIVELEYVNDGIELVIFKQELYIDTFELRWGWNKESLILFAGGVEYNQSLSYYSEVEFTCEKKD